MKKIIIACFLFILTFTSIALAHKPYSPLAVYKACLSNIRVIQGAVEKYNMDSPTAINDLNENTIDILVKNKYLKSAPAKPEHSCEYASIGNFSEDGQVYCKYHGGVDKDKIKPSPNVEREIEKYLDGRKRERIITHIFYSILGMLILYAIYRFLALFSPKGKNND